MYVVRIIPDIGEPDVKAFERLHDAQTRFYQGWEQADEGEFLSIAIFEVPDVKDTRAACEAVLRKNASLRLLELKEPFGKDMDRLASKVRGKLNIKL
jgi:hypothetical protein